MRWPHLYAHVLLLPIWKVTPWKSQAASYATRRHVSSGRKCSTRRPLNWTQSQPQWRRMHDSRFCVEIGWATPSIRFLPTSRWGAGCRLASWTSSEDGRRGGPRNDSSEPGSYLSRRLLPAAWRTIANSTSREFAAWQSSTLVGTRSWG